MNKIIIALEGIDGAGKSSITEFLKSKFNNQIVIYRRTQKGELIDKFVSSGFMRKHYMLQVPVYIFLSHVNFFKCKSQLKRNSIIIMDRCFLSNICYFYPKALKNKRMFNMLMFLEPKLFPLKIYILDVAPSIGQIRDFYKKDLEWLINTRNSYLDSPYSEHLKKYDIEIIDRNLSVEAKLKTIVNYIQGEIKNGNRQK